MRERQADRYLPRTNSVPSCPEELALSKANPGLLCRQQGPVPPKECKSRKPDEAGKLGFTSWHLEMGYRCPKQPSSVRQTPTPSLSLL